MTKSDRASASASGGKWALGTATTLIPAPAADRIPFAESSIATTAEGSTSRARAAAR